MEGNGVKLAMLANTVATDSVLKILQQLGVIVISLAIVGTYLYMLIEGNPNAGTLNPIVLGIIAYWLGNSITGAWAHVQIQRVQGVKRE